MKARFASALLFIAGAALTIASCARTQEGPSRPPLAEESTGGPLPRLTMLRPTDPAPTRLEVKYTEAKFGDKTIFVRTYNDRLVGPTLRARPGETLYIDLVNNLPEEEEGEKKEKKHSSSPGTVQSHHMTGSSGKDINIPHGFNVTNLHFHGLHVRPDYPSRCKGKENCDAVADNVYMVVPPGASPTRYEVEIPATHPPGTHWYHAHNHGSVAIQLASGMAGALIIEGGLDDVPEIKQAREEILVFQQFPLSDCGHNKVGAGEGPGQCTLENKDKTKTYFESCDAHFQRLVQKGKLSTYPKGASCVENFDLSFGPGQFEQLSGKTSINGELLPKIEFRVGELQRWRMVHAGIRETLMLGLIDENDESTQLGKSALDQAGEQRIPFQVIAYDGIATGRMDKEDALELQPGYRLDALVRIDRPGKYKLVDLATSAQVSLRAQDEAGKKLAIVNVLPKDENTPTMAFPKLSDLKKVAPQYEDEHKKAQYKDVEDNEVKGCQYATFDINRQETPNLFLINGQPYGSKHSEVRSVRLGEAEEWVVNSRFASHPFHIHVNPFQLVEKYGRLPKGIWKDTLLIKQGEPARLRTRYEDFTGKFVLHCHILDHEDQGMMQEVEVVPAGQRIKSCKRTCESCSNMCLAEPPIVCPEPRTDTQ